MRSILVKSLILVALSTAALADDIPKLILHEDAGLNVLELITKYGFPIERHGNIITEDGYILEMHRIPRGRSNQTSTKGPVLLMHGLLSSSADWCNNGNSSLAFILADLGYDVWMGNARGNTWSRNHTTVNPDTEKEKFWNFSYDEIGRYDLPVFIDYILGQTSDEQMLYVGHSQGTTALFVMAAELPEYNKKIKLMTALAPEAFVNHIHSEIIQILSIFEERVEPLAEHIGLYEFMPKNHLIELLGKEACDEGSPFQAYCSNFMFHIFGADPKELPASMIPVITTNAPAGCATKQLMHYAQGINSGSFSRWDYHTKEKNIEIYGQATPPDYDLKKITTPIAIYYAQNDLLASIIDVEHLISLLPNVVVRNKIAYKQFNHMDFLWAADVKELLYNDVIKVMERY